MGKSKDIVRGCILNEAQKYVPMYYCYNEEQYPYYEI